MTDSIRVGFVGAGRIGTPMVRRLIEAGHRVRALGRSAAARERLAQYGAEPVGDALEVAQESDVVCLCVLTDEQVRSVASAGALVQAMPPGSVLVVHTTASPVTIRDLGASAQDRGVEVVDAPISGGPQDVAAGRVTLYVGATDEGMRRARPALAAYADPILHLGAPGAGELVKLLNNAVFAANLGLLAAAVDTAAQLGVTETALHAGLQHGSGGSQVQTWVAAVGSVAQFAGTVGEFVAKDVAVVREVAAQLGADLGVLADAHRALGALLSSEQAGLLADAGRTPYQELHS
jgi:3-hydroxyisobutyrate dehydrogenase-like beta-hydroxyacid dehydrogenase